jgi:ATP-dependent Lon protease
VDDPQVEISTAVEEPVEDIVEEVPVLAVRETVLYPGALLPVTVGRPSSLALVQSLGENRLIAIVSQLDPRVESPGPEDLYQVGTLCVHLA